MVRAGRKVVIGVGGGIAAYKVCSLVRLFAESGDNVTVVPTAAALSFVGEATWAALSGNPVHTSVWDDVHEVPHVRIGQQADLVVIAPATADLMAKLAQGRADDLLTNVMLTARCPVLVAPAMHTEMWEHAATQANVATLRSRGLAVLDPAEGRLTGADTGRGRLPEPDHIFAAANALVSPERDLAGVKVVVSAGGTREPLDPVRFLGNRSSGRQGVAVAAAAAARGAKVTLVAAAIEVEVPAGLDVVRVETAEQLRQAMHDASGDAQVVVMAAAVADFRPVGVADHKIKKTADPLDAPVVRLERTADVLAELVAARTPGQVVVGFAAETGDATSTVLDHGRRKLASKGCDLLVVNDVSGGKVFGREDSQITILTADGAEIGVPAGLKSDLAEAIWDAIGPVLATRRASAKG